MADNQVLPMPQARNTFSLQQQQSGAADDEDRHETSSSDDDVENQKPVNHDENRLNPTNASGSDSEPHSLKTVATAAGGPLKYQLSFTGIDNVKKLRRVDELNDKSESIRIASKVDSTALSEQSTHVFVNPVSLRKLPQIVQPQAPGGGGNAMPDDGSGLKKAWRVERFQLQPVEEQSLGIFYSGDSYVIQYDSHGKGIYLYYWLGTHSSVDERGTAALKTIELDDQLGGLATHVRIVQGKEPPHFLAMFDGFIVILNGGYPSGFEPVHVAHAKAKDEAHGQFNGTLNIRDNHLLHVRAAVVGNDLNIAKDMKFGRAVEVDFRARSLNSNDVFVATTKARFACVWYGKGSSRVERALAHDVCKRVAPGGAHAHAQWTVNDPIAEGEEPGWFWEAIGGREAYANDKRLQQPSEETDSDIPHESPRLFHCSNATGKLTVEEVHGEFDQGNLISEDVMLLDTCDALWIWIGARANREERYHAEQFAQEYLKQEQRARCGENDAGEEVCVKLPLYCIKQGAEPVNFCGFFGVWDAKLAAREMQASWSARKQQPILEPLVFNGNGLDKLTSHAALEIPSQPEMHRSTPSPGHSPTLGSPLLPIGPLPTRDGLGGRYVKHELIRSKLPEELPFGVDPRCKEIYLDDEEFANAFDGMKYEDFQKLPKWRQLSMKKTAGLF